MISIVVHGILGTAYRQEVVVDGGSLADGDVKVLHDILHYLSNQYGDGTPTTGWALSAAPSGMWLHRVERAFDTNYAPAYLMFSFLIPRGKRLDDEAVLGRISREIILNHSKFIRQNVIQYECDWSFLGPLSQDVEGNFVPDGGAISGYMAPADGEVAFYQGGLSQMLRNMWNVSFARYGTVFCGKGLLTADREHPSVEVVEADPNAEMEMSQNPVADTIADRPADAEPQPEPMRTDNVNPPVDVNPQSKVRIMPDLQIDRECVYGPPIPSPAKRLSKRIAFGLLALVAVAVILPVIINHCGHEQEGDQFTSEVFKVNGVSFTMNKVEGGSFMMGAAADDSDAKDWEKPRHRVTLDGYYIGETEVTQELWEAVMNDNPSQFKGKQNPVEQVSYDDCLTFVQKLNDKTGKKFRLPTEAEWEFAARGGIHSKQYKYAGSDNIDDVAWYWRNSGDDYIGWDYCSDSLNSLEKNHHCQTHPVKRKQPNELGLYDMTGNVIEWCSDWYERYSGEEMYNPCGPDSNSIDKPMKVRRGGYYLQSAGSSRNTYRMYVSPKGRHEWLGFRLALSVANEN